MASTATLVAIIAATLLAVLMLRFVLWRLFCAVVDVAPSVVPSVSGSRLWVRGAQSRAKFAARHPRLARMLAGRVGLAGFTGLPLTLIVIAGASVLAALGGLIDDVRESDGLVRLDQGVDLFFAPYRAAWLLKVFLWVTALGAGPSLTAILCCATALLWSDRRRHLVIPLWLAFLGAQATTWSSKYIIARPRPAFLPNITEWNPSFPSGHATASTALIGMVGYVVALGIPTPRGRFEVAFWTAVTVALICFSRLFLGVHYLTDVAAGVLVGIFWLLVGITAARFRSDTTVGTSTPAPEPLPTTDRFNGTRPAISDQGSRSTGG